MNAKELGAQSANYRWEEGESRNFGLTKRELFAAMAMQGTLSNDAERFDVCIARDSVRMADFLLAELAKDQP